MRNYRHHGKRLMYSAYKTECKILVKKLKDEKINNRNPGSASNKKRNTWNEQVETETFTRFDRPVNIVVHTTRRRQTDNRAVEEKYFIDALVTAKILQDDRKTFVNRLDVPEPEIGKDEKTIIEIEEAEDLTIIPPKKLKTLKIEKKLFK